MEHKFWAEHRVGLWAKCCGGPQAHSELWFCPIQRVRPSTYMYSHTISWLDMCSLNLWGFDSFGKNRFNGIAGQYLYPNVWKHYYWCSLTKPGRYYNFLPSHAIKWRLLSLYLSYSLSPSLSLSLSLRNKAAKLKTNYKRDYLNVDADVDLQMTGPVFRGASVFMYNGWYGGFQLGYDTSTAKLVTNNVALGYQGTDFTVHASV